MSPDAPSRHSVVTRFLVAYGMPALLTLAVSPVYHDHTYECSHRDNTSVHIRDSGAGCAACHFRQFVPLSPAVEFARLAVPRLECGIVPPLCHVVPMQSFKIVARANSPPADSFA